MPTPTRRTTGIPALPSRRRRRGPVALGAATALLTLAACAPANSTNAVESESALPASALVASAPLVAPRAAAATAVPSRTPSPTATVPAPTTPAPSTTPAEAGVPTTSTTAPSAVASGPATTPADSTTAKAAPATLATAPPPATKTPSTPVRPGTVTTSAAPVLFLGAVGDVATLTKSTGSTLAVHAYGNFQGSVPTGRMVTVNAQGLAWSTVASAAPGSQLYRDMVRWADTLKARGGTIHVAFGHEPELGSKSGLGSAAQYKAAYQKVVTVFRSRGATNVVWVFQATDWAYRTSSSAPNYAGRWYPGDAYVDVVGADAYNWHTCGEGLGRDVPLSTVAGGVLTFAKAHGKKASLPEFGANITVNRTKWLTDGFAWLKANRSTFVAAFYFQHLPTNTANSDCVWPLKAAAEYTTVRTAAAGTWTAP